MQTYDHNQSASSASWVISHSLNTDAVAVDVFIDSGGNLVKIIPQDVVATDINTITVTFSSAQTGKARIVG